MATTAPARILTLDTIRGVAVMGILLLNIVAFGLIEAAYMNPAAQGGSSGLDLGVYLVNFVLFDGKMRGLFSFLFGASTLLVIDRATAKGDSAAKVHYARMVWLLIFGLAHLWLIWWGDILAHYALVGMIAYFFRNLRVKTLVIVAIVLLAVQWLILAGLAMFVTALANGGMPGQSPQDVAASLAEFTNGFGVPSTGHIAQEMAVHLGSYPEVAWTRFVKNATAPFAFVFMIGWETLGYMLLGMAGLKSGMLTGAWKRRRYIRWLAVSFGIGIPAYALIAAWLVRENFAMTAVVTGVMALSVPFRPLMIVGWASLIILLMRPGGALTARIAAAGRMAFTNYLVTSIVCTTIFYGYGFALFGQLHRAQLYLVVLAIWGGMLLRSKPWLDRFNYGPFEWLWRSLARGSLQVLRR
ncbi:MAG: DUF418 domain-containing protein [Pseudomonadota bacterium]